jgi:NADPH2:quinone reductase
MRAVVMNGYGGTEVLALVEMPRPVPGAGETLVRIRAAAVNPADGKWRAGMFAGIAPITFPHVLGYDIAGEVEGGEGFAHGTRVFGMLDAFSKGGYAEYVAAPTAQIAVIPDALDFQTAAAIPTAGLTGTQMAHAIDIEQGSLVLVTGAIGAVGRFAVHALKKRGARIVAAVRGAHRESALALGADEVVDLGHDDWPGPLFDHVLDTVGGEEVGRLCTRLKPGGRILTAATTPIPVAGLPAQPEFFRVQPDARQTRQLGEAVAAGEIEVAIAKVLPLSKAQEAQALTDRGGLGGKVILVP